MRDDDFGFELLAGIDFPANGSGQGERRLPGEFIWRGSPDLSIPAIEFPPSEHESGHITEEPVLTDPFSFAPTNGGSANTIGAIFRGISGVIGALGAPSQVTNVLSQIPRSGGIGPGMGGVVGPQVEVETGMPISSAGLACTVKRRRYKIVRTPEGIKAVAYCLPRRMNPLNPRALARAGRRVASFSRIAKGMQQMLERACKVGARSKRRSYSGPRCAPKGCR